MRKRIPVLCPCGCNIIRPMLSFNSKRGHFIRGHRPHSFSNLGLSFIKAKNRWMIYCRDGTQVYFARAIVEFVIKRELKSNEIVHHANGDSTEDCNKNLVLCSHNYHTWLHRTGRILSC